MPFGSSKKESRKERLTYGVCVCLCVCVCERERERERGCLSLDRQTDNETEKQMVR